MKGIVGRPTAGMRLSVERVERVEQGLDAGAAIYRGFVHLPASDVPAEAEVGLVNGAVKMTLGEGGTPEMQKWASALLRATTKAPVASGAALPRKIVRWRP